MKGTNADTERIVRKALACGASLAGISPAAALAASRSYAGGQPMRCAVKGHSLLVLALAQGDDWPQFDWWDSQPGGTPGNRRLIEIMAEVIAWLDEKENIRSVPLPYNIEKGGILLKGAAILSGLGTIGNNNLLLTPAFGPRVRLRAILIEGELAQTAPGELNLCESCDLLCHRACPQNAFADGTFDRKRCSIQMRIDKLERGTPTGGWGLDYLQAPIKYCRACELTCPRANP